MVPPTPTPQQESFKMLELVVGCQFLQQSLKIIQPCLGVGDTVGAFSPLGGGTIKGMD